MTVEFNDGRFGARGTNRTFDFLELAKEAAKEIATASRRSQGRARRRHRQRDARSGFPQRLRRLRDRGRSGDRAGAITRYASVDDVGRCINPLIVDGQTHGAIAQGIGQAMWELSRRARQRTAALRLAHGLRPAARRYAALVRTEIAEVLSPTNPLGIKAGGEGGTTAAPAVVISAILDALREFGVSDIDMPATPFGSGRRYKPRSGSPD